MLHFEHFPIFLTKIYQMELAQKSYIYTYMKQFETLAILISSKTNETCKAITASGKNLIKI